MNLMSIEYRIVLHFVCKDRLFSADTFVRGESTQALQNDNNEIWVCPHVVHLQVTHVDSMHNTI